jgi:hypothetical protein
LVLGPFLRIVESYVFGGHLAITAQCAETVSLHAAPSQR